MRATSKKMIPKADAGDYLYITNITPLVIAGLPVEVMRSWAAALRPGGLLRIFVPNPAKLAEKYLAGDFPEFPEHFTVWSNGVVNRCSSKMSFSELSNALDNCGFTGIIKYRKKGVRGEIIEATKK